MKSCIACSMPLSDPKDIGGVQFFMDVARLTDRALAEKLTRKNMNILPYWQKNKGSCLDGTEASDKEFSEIMSKL